MALLIHLDALFSCTKMFFPQFVQNQCLKSPIFCVSKSPVQSLCLWMGFCHCATSSFNHWVSGVCVHCKAQGISRDQAEDVWCVCWPETGAGSWPPSGLKQMKASIFFPNESPFPLEILSFGSPGTRFLPLAVFLTMSFFSHQSCGIPV